MSGPLHGVRILDLTRLLPGPACTLALADLGADVVKIEEPERGDYLRDLPPLVDGVSAYHRALNRGKRSVALDLRTVEGREALLALARASDVMIESFRPGVLERLGVGHEALRAANPRLVTCAITGYGQDGPYRDRAGHDLNYEGLAGVLALTGEEGGPPVIPGVQVADLVGALAATTGVLAALHEAGRTGRGRFVDASLLDAAVWALAIPLPAALAGAEVRRGAEMLTGGLACYRLYPAGDGRWLAVAALEYRFWAALCEQLGLPDLIEDHLGPAERQREMAERLAEVFARASRDAWVERLGNLEVCVGPVNDLRDVLADPHLIHRGSIARVGGEAVGPGPAVRVEGATPALRPAPRLGEHTEEVLGELAG